MGLTENPGTLSLAPKSDLFTNNLQASCPYAKADLCPFRGDEKSSCSHSVVSMKRPSVAKTVRCSLLPCAQENKHALALDSLDPSILTG